ncbi:MAG: DNA recombination protein RmuC, partial [Amphiplicatus sp.]|nr:DNA recombination protein RmuC [Amphiplicatus sp.]
MAALDQQRRSIEDQERSLAEQAYAVDRQFEELRRDLADELDARFEAIAARVEEKLSHASASDASPSGAASEDQISAIAELISRRLGEERDALDGAIATLSNRLESVADRADAAADLRQEIAALKRSVSSLSAHGLAGRSAAPSAPTVQLADVIRAALPAKSYEMRALLSNGRRADCLIRLPHLAGPIAVDGQFPAEAFLRLRAPGAAESLRAENEFRRAALRHIADVAEHLIVPGETADSALLFIPSE